MEVKMDDGVWRDEAGRAKQRLHRNRHQAGSRGFWANQTGANEPHSTPIEYEVFLKVQGTHALFYRARQGSTPVTALGYSTNLQQTGGDP